MAYIYRIEKDLGRVRIDFSGRVELPELERMVEEISKDPEFSSDFSILTNAHEAEFAVALGELKEFASTIEEKLKGGTGKSALVVRTPHETALAMMHSKNVKRTRQVGVFHSIGAAIEWLDAER